jgi:hypothetical protein
MKSVLKLNASLHLQKISLIGCVSLRVHESDWHHFGLKNEGEIDASDSLVIRK